MNEKAELVIKKSSSFNTKFGVEFIKDVIRMSDLKPGDTVAAAFWCSPKIIKLIYDIQPLCKVFYVEDKLLKNVYGIIDNAIFVDVYNGEYIYNMKFDKTIMNPPFGTAYNPYLHNNIYIKACECSDTVVCLMPAGKLQTPRKINSTELDLTKTLTNELLIVTNSTASKAFKTGQAENLGIYIHKNGLNSNIDWEMMSFKNSEKLKSIYNKVKDKKLKTLLNAKEKCPVDFSIKVSENHGHPGSNDEYDIISPDIKIAYSTKISSQSVFFNFKSENEAENFRQSLMTTFMKYLRYIERNSTHIYIREYPYMEDYTQPWTNQRFCEYFGITGFISDTEAEPGSEWEEILNTMKDYM